MTKEQLVSKLSQDLRQLITSRMKEAQQVGLQPAEYTAIVGALAVNIATSACKMSTVDFLAWLMTNEVTEAEAMIAVHKEFARKKAGLPS